MSDWLNLPEAADYTRLRESTLRSLVRNKKLRCSRPAKGELVFHTDWLDEYLNTHTVAVVENRFGLTDQALNNLQADRATRGRKSA